MRFERSYHTALCTNAFTEQHKLALTRTETGVRGHIRGSSLRDRHLTGHQLAASLTRACKRPDSMSTGWRNIDNKCYREQNLSWMFLAHKEELSWYVNADSEGLRQEKYHSSLHCDTLWTAIDWSQCCPATNNSQKHSQTIQELLREKSSQLVLYQHVPGYAST